jgi:hypothetical protein
VGAAFVFFPWVFTFQGVYRSSVVVPAIARGNSSTNQLQDSQTVFENLMEIKNSEPSESVAFINSKKFSEIQKKLTKIHLMSERNRIFFENTKIS